MERTVNDTAHDHDIKPGDKPMNKHESVGRLPQHQPDAAEQALALLRIRLALGRCARNINGFFYVLHLAHLPVVQALDEQRASVVD